MVDLLPMQSMEERLARAPAVIASRSDEEAVLVLPALGQIKVLNEVGMRVWELLDGNRSAAQVIATIAAEYEVAPARAEADVLVFLAELRAKGLLRPVDEA